MKPNQFNSDGPETISHLAGAIQDMWHYAALICPLSDGRISTFEGDRELAGLVGKCVAYANLYSKVQAWSKDYLPAFCNLELLSPSQIDSVATMQAEVRKIQTAIDAVAEANNIEPYSGETAETWDEIKGKAHLYKTARLRSTGEYVQLVRIVHFVDGLELFEPVFACRVAGFAGVEHRTTDELCDFCL